LIRMLATILLVCHAPSAVIADARYDQENTTAWMLNCQGCHRSYGGATGNEVPALRGTVAKFLAVPGGREYLIRVPGVSMSPLDNESVAALTNWMLYEFDPDNVPDDFERYSADEVGKLRLRPYDSEAATIRADLIEKIDSQDRL